MIAEALKTVPWWITGDTARIERTLKKFGSLPKPAKTDAV